MQGHGAVSLDEPARWRHAEGRVRGSRELGASVAQVSNLRTHEGCHEENVEISVLWKWCSVVAQAGLPVSAEKPHTHTQNTRNTHTQKQQYGRIYASYHDGFGGGGLDGREAKRQSGGQRKRGTSSSCAQGNNELNTQAAQANNANFREHNSLWLLALLNAETITSAKQINGSTRDKRQV